MQQFLLKLDTCIIIVITRVLNQLLVYLCRNTVYKVDVHVRKRCKYVHVYGVFSRARHAHYFVHSVSTQVYHACSILLLHALEILLFVLPVGMVTYLYMYERYSVLYCLLSSVCQCCSSQRFVLLSQVSSTLLSMSHTLLCNPVRTIILPTFLSLRLPHCPSRYPWCDLSLVARP